MILHSRRHDCCLNCYFHAYGDGDPMKGDDGLVEVARDGWIVVAVADDDSDDGADYYYCYYGNYLNVVYKL